MIKFNEEPNTGQESESNQEDGNEYVLEEKSLGYLRWDKVGEIFPPVRKFSGSTEKHAGPSGHFSNEELGIEIVKVPYTYDPGAGHGMSYGDKFLLARKNGTYQPRPLDIRWRGSRGVEPSAKSVESVVIEDGYVHGLFRFSDGTQEKISLGPYEPVPVYQVYRNNDGYRELGGLDQLHGPNNLVSVSEEADYILEQGKLYDSAEGEALKEKVGDIPAGSVILADEAALVAMPGMKEGNAVISIDKKMDRFRKNNLEEALSKLENAPRTIDIFVPNIGDHPMDEITDYRDIAENGSNWDEEGISDRDRVYVELLEEKLRQHYPYATINQIKTSSDAQASTADLLVHDSHAGTAMGVRSQELAQMIDGEVLMLPLYNQMDEYQLQRFREQVLESLDADITRASKHIAEKKRRELEIERSKASQD